MARGPVVNVTVTGDSKGAQTALGDLANRIPGVGGVMGQLIKSGGDVGSTLGAVIPGAAVAGAAALAAFAVKSVASFAAQAQEVLHFKEVSGLAADEASRFVAVADDYGVAADSLSTAIGKMNKTAGDTPEKLKAVGVEIGKNSQGAYDSEKTFLNVVDAYNATNDASEKARIGAAAFGKGWQSVVRILDQGSGKLKADFAAVKGFQIFNDADLAKAEAWRHAMDDLGDAIKGIQRELGEKLIPVLTEVANRLTNLAERAAKPDGGGGWFGWIIKGAEEVGKAVADHFAPMIWVLDQMTKETGMQHIVTQAEAIALAIPKATASAAELALEMQRQSDVEVYAASNNAYRKYLDDTAGAAQKVIDKLQALFDMKNADARSDIGLQQAWYGVIKSYDTLTASVADATAKKGLDHDANLKVLEDTANYKSAILDMADADAKQYGNKYKLQHDSATASDVAAEAEKGYRLSLIATLQKMDPNDPERKWLQDYIDTLYSIPSKVDTAITLNTSGVLPGQAGQRIGKYAEGGYIPGPKNAPQLAIVHGGEYVVSNAMQARGGSGSQYTVNVTAGWGADGHGIGEAIVGELKKYESRNGPGWRSAA